jgi:hypothetical protein
MSTTAEQGGEGQAGQEPETARELAASAPEREPDCGSVPGTGDSPAPEIGPVPNAGRGAWPGRLAWVAGTAIAAVLLTWAYLLESRLYKTNSDGAGEVLMGWDMLHGNLLLRGWWTADVSFYTFEIPVDAVVAAVHGLNSDVAHVTAAICYAALLVVSALLARGRARGWAGVIPALLTAGILLAPGGAQSNGILLGSPDHIGVSVPIVLAFLLIDRAPGTDDAGRARWWVPTLMFLILVWAQLDDPIAEFAAAFAVAVVCLARAGLGWRNHRRGEGNPGPGANGVAPDGQRVPRYWYDAALGVAALVSYVVSQLLVGLIRDVGGYSMRGLGQIASVVPLARWGSQTGVTAYNTMILFGADFWEQPTAVETAISVLHLVGLLLAVCGTLAGIASLVRRGDRVTQIVAIGTLVTLGAGAYASDMTKGYAAHEIAVVLPFGAILVGRTIGPWLAKRLSAHEDTGSRVPDKVAGFAIGRASGGKGGRPPWWILPALGVVGLGYAASLGFYASQPSEPGRTQDLADWLTAHHMATGLGTYWAGTETTVSSGGKTLVIPMSSGNPENPYPWITQPGWYNPDEHDATFVVAGTDPSNGMQYSPAAVTKAFGAPAREYRFGSYIIMAYHRNLLRQTVAPVQPDPEKGLQL